MRLGELQAQLARATLSPQGQLQSQVEVLQEKEKVIVQLKEQGEQKIDPAWSPTCCLTVSKSASGHLHFFICKVYGNNRTFFRGMLKPINVTAPTACWANSRCLINVSLSAGVPGGNKCHTELDNWRRF